MLLALEGALGIRARVSSLVLHLQEDAETTQKHRDASELIFSP